MTFKKCFISQLECIAASRGEKTFKWWIQKTGLQWWHIFWSQCIAVFKVFLKVFCCCNVVLKPFVCSVPPFSHPGSAMSMFSSVPYFLPIWVNFICLFKLSLTHSPHSHTHSLVLHTCTLCGHSFVLVYLRK